MADFHYVSNATPLERTELLINIFLALVSSIPANHHEAKDPRSLREKMNASVIVENFINGFLQEQDPEFKKP